MDGWKEIYTEELIAEDMEANATGSEYEKWTNNKDE